MSRSEVLEHIDNIEELAKKEGLDFFPTIFEFVDKDIMLEACSYGLPCRARHWSYGRSYDHQRVYGEMGLSKVYEIVFNNDPAYAFLLNTNPDIINIMVAAHVLGHCHFFKHNCMFESSDKSMIYRSAERAARIDDHIEEHGLDKVEHLMDIGFALDNHIDWHKGLYRERYEGKKTVEEKINRGEFEDLLNFGDYSKRSIQKRTVGENFPPSPEKDLLWFLINYAPIEKWEKDVLEIIREESYYFYPIVMTKVMNEGFACVLPDTMVFTKNGILKMKDVVEKRPVIFDGLEKQKITHSGIFKNKETIRIHTKRGLTICGANNHRILDNMGLWEQLDEVKIGDLVKICGGQNLWSSEYQAIDFKALPVAKSGEQLCKENNISYSTYYRYINGKNKTKSKNIKKINRIINEIKLEKERGHISSMGNRSVIQYPKKSSEDLGYFSGYLIGDGHVSSKARQVGLTTGDCYSADHFIALCRRLFDVMPNKIWDATSKNGRWRLPVYSKNLIDFCTSALEMGTGKCASKKQIPSIILKSPKSVITSFMRAYFDCDGCASEKQGVILSTSSDKLSEQAQTVLLNYGILSSRKKAKDGCWQLRITGLSAKKFYDEIGFGLERKQEKLKKYIENRKWFKTELWQDKIVKIESCGNQDVYDISVEGTQRYAAAGFINHNSFWHAELMFKYEGTTEEEHIDFCKCHSGVVSPGSPFNINPYYLGFKIFTDIRKRWDKLHKDGESDINGIQKIIEVAAEENDASFLRNYLTKELVRDLGLFNYGYRYKREPGQDEDNLPEEYGIIELKDRDLNKIIENITKNTLNYGAPLITIDEVDGDVLVLKHSDRLGPLDEKYTEKTMEYMYELWGGPVELSTNYDGSDIVYCFDESGFDLL